MSQSPGAMSHEPIPTAAAQITHHLAPNDCTQNPENQRIFAIIKLVAL
jgi:hypothetical protein